MTGFAIFIYFFSSFTSNKKTWTHLRLKFLQFLSTFSSNLQKQFSNLLSSTISCERRCNIIPRKKFLASIRQLSVDTFQRIQYYSTNVQFLCHNGRHSSIFQEAWNIYIYIFATIITWRRERSEISEEVCIGWPMYRSVQGRSIESPVVIPTCS